MPTTINICTIPGRYCPIGGIVTAALLWRASKIDALPSLVCTAMRVSMYATIATTSLAVATSLLLPKLHYVVKINRIVD